MPDPRQFLIVGVGNLLCRDDGVGVHAARQLEREPMAGVRVVEVGTAILHGLDFLESARRVLVIDAARGDGPPGTVYLFDGAKTEGAEPLVSVHAMGLREAAQWLLPEGSRPAITVIGVEPESLGYGMELSAPVRAALPRVVRLARETVGNWLGEVAHQDLFEYGNCA